MFATRKKLRELGVIAHIQFPYEKAIAHRTRRRIARIEIPQQKIQLFAYDAG
jgi:hypothetical protein